MSTPPADLDALLGVAVGFRVLAGDRRDVGGVEDVRFEEERDPSHLVVVRQGRFPAGRRAIPFDAVAQVDAEARVVGLGIGARAVRRLPRSPHRLDDARAVRCSYLGMAAGALAGGLLAWTVAPQELVFTGLLTGWQVGGALGLGAGGGFAGHIRWPTGRGLGNEIGGDLTAAIETGAGGVAGFYIGDVYGQLVGLGVGFAAGELTKFELRQLAAKLRTGIPDPYFRDPAFRRSLEPRFVLLSFLLALAVWWPIGSSTGLSAVETIAGAAGTVLVALSHMYLIGSMNQRAYLELERLPCRVLVYLYRRSDDDLELLLEERTDGLREGIRARVPWGAFTEDVVEEALADRLHESTDTRGALRVGYRHRIEASSERLQLEEIFAAEAPAGSLVDEDTQAAVWCAISDARGLLTWPESRDPLAVSRSVAAQ